MLETPSPTRTLPPFGLGPDKTRCPESSTPNTLSPLSFSAWDNHLSPTAVCENLTSAFKRPSEDANARSDSILAARCQSFFADLRIWSAISSPSTTLHPSSVDSISRHLSPSPSSAAAIICPAGFLSSELIMMCSDFSASPHVHESVGFNSPAPQFSFNAGAFVETSFALISISDRNSANQELAAPFEESTTISVGRIGANNSENSP